MSDKRRQSDDLLICLMFVAILLDWKMAFANTSPSGAAPPEMIANRHRSSIGESGKPKKACNLCFHGATVRSQDYMLQDEAVRTWSGDIQNRRSTHTSDN
jgi:hypothetical protein